jgi:hypothetical protein
MTKRVRITHERPGYASNHIFQNFGEDLWRLTRDDRRWTVSLDEIDGSDHPLDVMVRSSVLK